MQLLLTAYCASLHKVLLSHDIPQGGSLLAVKSHVALLVAT